MKSNDVKLSYGLDYFMVTAFKDVNGDPIHPMDEIRAYSIESGRNIEVKADIVDKLPSDENGNPIYTEWTKAGYLCSSHSRRWINEIDAWREKNSKHQNSKETSDSRLANLIMIGELSADDLENVFNLDWQHITWGWLGLVEGDNSLEDIKQIIHDNYRLICNIFTHFCGEGAGIFAKLLSLFRNLERPKASDLASF